MDRFIEGNIVGKLDVCLIINSIFCPVVELDGNSRFFNVGIGGDLGFVAIEERICFPINDEITGCAVGKGWGSLPIAVICTRSDIFFENEEVNFCGS